MVKPSLTFMGAKKQQTPNIPKKQEVPKRTTPDTTETENGINSLILACRFFGLSKEQTSYVLATAQHETMNRYVPVGEAYYTSNPERVRRSFPYYPYYGRGQVQTTHKENYQRVDEAFGSNTVKNPDEMYNMNLSALASVYGMREGWYGLPLSNFVNSSKKDYYNARRSVNSTDRADLVKRYAEQWENKLNEMGYINDEKGRIYMGRPESQLITPIVDSMYENEIKLKYPKLYERERGVKK